MVDKLSKALDGLKNHQFMTTIEEKNVSKKTKMLSLAAEVMVSVKPANLQNLPFVIENLINMCDDEDSDVRMVADESLNKVIMSLPESNMPKVQLELHKIIKKNGPARSLRAALTRFGQVCQYVRPNKGRVHVQMLVPCLIEISKREEESVHETLASSFEKIFKVLGVFLQDTSLKALIKAFLHNLSASNPVIRRCSATCIIKLVLHCRKPHVFNSYVLNSLLDCVVPVSESNTTDLILGVLGCLRLLLPTFTSVKHDEGISGSFGLRRKPVEAYFLVDQLIQAYELCLHYAKNKDHNVVAAALETLNQILQDPPQRLKTFFLSPAGFSRSYVQSTRENRLSSRSGSEMSVTCSLPPADESLLDDSELATQLASTFSSKPKQTTSKPKEKFGFSEEDVKLVENPFRDKVFGKAFGSQTSLDDSDTESSIVSESNTPPLLPPETEDKEPEESCEMSRSNSQDNLYSPNESEVYNSMHGTADTGSFTDAAVPLIFCARYLADSFLLDTSSNSLKSDRVVRVSIKSLAFSCLSAIVKMYPVVLRMNVSKTAVDCSNQEMCDVLLFADHCDPQIRGCVNVLVGSFVWSALLDSKGFDSDWLNDEKSRLSCRNLIEILLKGLKDSSSVCNRQALSAVKMCMDVALLTPYNHLFLPLLEFLPVLTDNSYWLAKVKLVEVLSDLPYGAIKDLLGSDEYQNEVVDFVLFPLLGDEDARVRQAAARALVRIIPKFTDGTSSVFDNRTFTADLNRWLKAKDHNGSSATFCPPFSYAFMDPNVVDYSKNVEFSLSKIVAKLTNALMVSENNNFLFGYLEALKLLTEEYPTTVYQNGWNCSKPKGERAVNFLTSDLVTFVFSMLVTSSAILDLTSLSNATSLLANLFAGHSISNLKTKYHASLPIGENGLSTAEPLWNAFTNEKLSQLAEEIFTHLLKVLNLYNGLIEDVPNSTATETASSSASSSTAGDSILPLLSPIKKHEKKSESKSEDKKGKNSAGCPQSQQTLQYVRMQKLLKNAYATFKVSLDKPVGDKFLELLDANLYALSVMLEVGTVRETGRCAEEILSYMRSVVSLRASSTVTCVSQLLKSLFGTNLASNWEEKKLPSFNYQGLHLFDTLFHLPPEFLSEKLHRRMNLNSLECDNLSGCHRKPDRKLLIKYADKNWLATYIRLFEPMVVKSLQLYTISGNVTLQSNVLQLINQLVQLRVNYCLLDEKQIFVGFVLKQFELIEQGQIPGVEVLLPHIFKFLILLSYEKQHSKPITSIPKILQLCDALMASDQPVLTHCVPALVPVAEDVFLLRNLSQDKELETQREVLLSMLLRLAEFPKVMDILASVLNDSKSGEGKERWKRWSRQVADVMLSLSSQDRLQIETFEGQNSFLNLMTALSPNVLRPIDPLLKAMFVEPNDYNCSASLNRWLSRVTVILETVLFVKEDALLNRVDDVAPNVNLTSFIPRGAVSSPDPFNVDSFFQVYESSETVARFLLKVVAVVASKILDSFPSSGLLEQKLSVLFVCIYHILKSGTFHRITNSLRLLPTKEQDSFAPVLLLFKRLRYLCPLLTCQFSYFLTLLNFCDHAFWNDVLRLPSTLPGKFVQSCGVVALTDYLCDNLSDSDTLHYLLRNNLREILLLSHEIPVKELLMMIRLRQSDWEVFLDAVDSADFESGEPVFVEKLLRLLEGTSTSHGVALVRLLVGRYLATPRLALSLLAGSIACRHVEFLLTQPRDKVVQEMNEETFRRLMDFFAEGKYLKRHSNLWNLLKRLGLRLFPSEVADLCKPDEFSTENLKRVLPHEDWYFSQVKQRCSRPNHPGPETAILLNKLTYERILEVFRSADFNLKILKDCLAFPETLRRRYDADELDSAHAGNHLFRAAKSRLLDLVDEVVRKVAEARRKLLQDTGDNSFEVLDKSQVGNLIWDVAPSLTYLLEATYAEDLDVDAEHVETIAEFGFLCVEVVNLTLRKEGGTTRAVDIYQNNIEIGFRCSATILSSTQIRSFMSQRKNFKLCVDHVHEVIGRLVPRFRFCRLREEWKIKKDEDVNCRHLERLRFLLKLVTAKSKNLLLPSYLFDCIRHLVVNICRIPEFSRDVLRVPEGDEMQDIEHLEDFISKFSAVGWSSKQQFEEIWVALLAVLGFNTQGDVPVEESGFVVQVRAQASSMAVEGITTLLKNTMIDGRSRRLIHHGRDFLTMKSIYQKLPLVSEMYKEDGSIDRLGHFTDNLEIDERSQRYVHGLLSIEYLWTAVKQIAGQVDLYEKHSEELARMGLDLPSCIYLLTELYNQWVYQAVPDIRIITSSLKSSIVISDLFTDIAHFQWLLNFCLRIDDITVKEDVVLLPLIILGSAKAAAVVLPDSETCEKIKKLMLRSNNVPCRTATVQGLLYLLQSYVVCYAVNHTSLPPPGSTFDRDDANFVANIVDTFLPVAFEVVQQFKLKSENETVEFERCHWSLVFYLLQNYQSSLGDLKEEFLSFVLATLRGKNCPATTMELLVRGIERILLTTVVDEHFKDQISKISLDIISANSVATCGHGLQLMVALSFLDKRGKDIRQLVTGQEDPEKVMKDMEKINVLFEKLKRSYPKEAEVVGEILAYVLRDFTASDVLTKVIQEFLSSQQPHQKILAGLLFKVFERAEIGLLEDWVVFSLPSLIQGMPISVSIWILNCFFVSASNEPWLRSLFPLVQSRMRMTEVEDKKLLCLSGALFYKQLKQKSQKMSFVKAFEKAAATDPVFMQLLSSLTHC